MRTVDSPGIFGKKVREMKYLLKLTHPCHSFLKSPLILSLFLFFLSPSLPPPYSSDFPMVQTQNRERPRRNRPSRRLGYLDNRTKTDSYEKIRTIFLHAPIVRPIFVGFGDALWRFDIFRRPRWRHAIRSRPIPSPNSVASKSWSFVVFRTAVWDGSAGYCETTKFASQVSQFCLCPRSEIFSPPMASFQYFFLLLFLSLVSQSSYQTSRNLVKKSFS